MEPDAGVILSAFKYLTKDDEQICRLCLSPTPQYAKYIQDSVILKKPYYEDTVTYTEMFEELGVSEEPLLPQTLCDTCARAITNGYLFKKLHEHSKEQWDTVLSSLNKTLMQAETVSPSVKTVYIVLSETGNYIVTRRKTLSPDKETAALKLNKIIKSRCRYVHRKKTCLICEECGMKFKTRVLLVRHMKSHKAKPLNCPQCFKAFLTQVQLTEHAERVHYPKKIKCPKCKKMFSTQRTLKAHDRQEHVAVLCKLCFVQFPSRSALKVHLDKHDVIKCPRCNKSFINKQTFRSHVKQCGNAEAKVISFFCDICEKGYIRKNALRSHLKIDHGFGKVLSCSWCAKKFDAASRLRNHIVKHTRERNFSCEHCNGKFVTQAALVYHTRLHTGERPFKCDLCEESFLSASRRMEHKRRKHFGPQMECPVCHVKFVLGSQLKKHVARHSDPQSKLYVPTLDGKQERKYVVRNVLTRVN